MRINLPRLLFRSFCFIPILYLTWLAFQGQLGAEPVKELNHKAGEYGFYFLLLNLAIGGYRSLCRPQSQWFRWLWAERRFIGVFGFLILVGHVFFYFALEAFEKQALDQIFTKTYLTLGSLAFVILLLLTLTSMDLAVRKLGKNWKRLHRFVHLAALLTSVHIMLIEKADLLYFGSILLLYWLFQILRFVKSLKK